MRLLLVSFVIAALIVSMCNFFMFPTHRLLTVLNQTVISLTVFLGISSLVLRIPEQNNGRRVFAVGALTPIFCLIFGNTEIFKLLGRINYSVISEIFRVRTDQVTGLIAGTAVVSLASGLLTLVCFVALRRAPAAGEDMVAESGDSSASQIDS